MATRVKGLKTELSDFETAETRARHIVERMALTLQGALLVRDGDPAIADAFCASRLAGDWGHAFGTLPAGIDHRAIIDRHLPPELAAAATFPSCVTGDARRSDSWRPYSSKEMLGGRSIPLVRMFGIRIGVDPSWFLALFLFIWWLTNYCREGCRGAKTAPRSCSRRVSTLLFFLSILLHELGHAIVAIRNGIAIAGIDLWLFGGVAKMSRDTQSPGVEFRVAVAGPLVTLADRDRVAPSLVCWWPAAGTTSATPPHSTRRAPRAASTRCWPSW